jgi:hypothetical protein
MEGQFLNLAEREFEFTGRLLRAQRWRIELF